MILNHNTPPPCNLFYVKNTGLPSEAICGKSGRGCP